MLHVRGGVGVRNMHERMVLHMHGSLTYRNREDGRLEEVLRCPAQQAFPEQNSSF